MEKNEGQVLTKDPGLKDKKKSKANIYYLSPDEITKIIDATESLRDRVVLKILANTGMRRFELCQLMVKNVDFDAKRIFIPHGKGDEARSVPVDEDTLKDLKFYLDNRRYGRLIQSNNKSHDGIDESRINLIVSKSAEKADIKNPDPVRKHLNPHIFRHSFVRNMIKMGVPQSHVQQMVGHRDIRTTIQMYGIPGFKDTQETYEKAMKEMYKK